MNDSNNAGSGPSHDPFDANILTEMLASYQQTLRANGKAWMTAWGLVTKPDPSSWFEDAMRVWQEWYSEMLEASGGWWPGARWLDRDQLSTMSFVIDPKAESVGPKELPLPVTTDGDVTLGNSDLAPLGSRTAASIPKLHVEAKIDRRRRTLSVSLVNLKKLGLKPNQQFLGCIYVHATPEVPLTLLHVLVAPAR